MIEKRRSGLHTVTTFFISHLANSHSWWSLNGTYLLSPEVSCDKNKDGPGIAQYYSTLFMSKVESVKRLTSAAAQDGGNN